MFDIIDFHTHPMLKKEHYLCAYKNDVPITPEEFKEHMLSLGISRICGAVVDAVKLPTDEEFWAKGKEHNECAMKLKEMYGDFYIPGITINPKFPKESCETIEKYAKLGVKLIGELVPYLDGWNEWEETNARGMDEILETAQYYDMTVSYHGHCMYIAKNHPKLKFVAAHPGEFNYLPVHLECMRLSENYHLDISANGVTRYGMLELALKEFGSERLVYGSDFPACNPTAFIGSILLDKKLTDKDKENILSKNAERLLGL